MRRTTLPVICTIISIVFAAITAYGQNDDPIVKFLLKRGYNFPDTNKTTTVIHDSLKQWPDTLYYNVVYKPKLMRTPTIPISFSKVEYVNGQYQVVPTISLGYGYTWFLGDFIFNENDKITVDPSIYFGLVADAGLQSDFNIKKISINPYNYLGSIFAGGFVGFGTFSLFVGYDFISHSPSIAIGGRVDLYTMNQKFLKPIGKIRSVRKHKSKNVTPEITNE